MFRYPICALVIWFFSITAVFSQARLTENLNSNWEFIKSNQSLSELLKEEPSSISWKRVHLPHSWNDKDVLQDGERGYYRGQAWYKKNLFHLQPENNKRYYIRFEGANQETSLYVNGQKVGDHVGGYSAFQFEITDFLKPEINQIWVSVDNAHNPDIPPLSADFTFFGGIYRDVHLITTHKNHISLADHGSFGVYVDTPEIDEKQATLRVRSLIDGQDLADDSQLLVRLKDKVGREVLSSKINLTINQTEATTTFDLQDFELWSPENPYLYTVEVDLLEGGKLVDCVYSKTGLRWFHFDANKGFFLNGKPYKLIGVNRHQDQMGFGNALTDDHHRHDLQIIKDMGANILRLAHYPQDPAVLEAADELGIMIWEETPLVNEVTLSQKHDENSVLMVREMIRQHYNNPSVIIWGYMNEIYWAHRFLDEQVVDAHTEHTVNLAQKLEDLCRQEDPLRYTAMALHNYPLYEESKLTEIPMIVSWNLYHGWYYDSFEDLGKFLDEQHAKYPNRILFLSEFGAGSDVRLHSDKFERFDFTVEGQKAFLESFLKQIVERDYLSGATVWNLIDFSSERRIDAIPHLNSKGIMSADRKPKDTYYLFRSYLNKEKQAWIAERNHKVRSGVAAADGKLRQKIQVYSNLAAISLYVDGLLIADANVVDYSTYFDVALTKGSHLLEVREKATNMTLDALRIAVNPIFESYEAGDDIDIAINAGSNYSFYDNIGDKVWLSDKAYTRGSWGYIGGEKLYVADKIGTKEDILTQTDFNPLLQTMRLGGKGYQFDLPDGWYEVELSFVEAFPKSRRFIEGIESPEHPGKERVFDVVINDQTLINDLDLLGQYGYNYPLRKRWTIQINSGMGLNVNFPSSIGEPSISAIRVRSL